MSGEMIDGNQRGLVHPFAREFKTLAAESDSSFFEAPLITARHAVFISDGIGGWAAVLTPQSSTSSSTNHL